MPYALYLRKSRADIEAEARGEGETLARHEAVLLSLANTLQLDIGHIYRELESGESIAGRPAMQQLLCDVGQELWQGVLVMEIERLARGDTIDQGVISQTFKYSGTRIITPVKTYEPGNEFDEEYFEFGLFMSRKEYKAINRRMQMGRLQSVREGKYMGNIAPYGYDIVPLTSQKGNTLSPNAGEAQIVRHIFGWYVHDGLGVSAIARRLNDAGVPTKKNSRWNTTTILDILRNVTYTGKVRWKRRGHQKRLENGRVVTSRPRAQAYMQCDGLHDALVSNDLFAQAQALLAGHPSPPVPGRYKQENPLAGLITCSECGRTMTKKKMQHGPDILMCPNAGCPTVGSYFHVVEEAVLDAVQGWASGRRVSVQKRPQDEAQGRLIQNGLRRLGQEIEALSTQSSNLHDLLEQGVYDADTFLQRSRSVHARLETAQQEQKRMQAVLDQLQRSRSDQADLVPHIMHVVDAYREIDDTATRNKLMKEILSHITYTKTQRAPRGHDPGAHLQLDVYPKVKQ